MHEKALAKNLSKGLTLCAISIALFACGKSDKQPDAAPGSPQRGSVVPSLTNQERANYCFVYTAPETDSELIKKFLDQLDGTWKHIPAATSGDDTVKKFTFSQERRYASLSSANNIFREDITYKKLCVSKPLAETAGDFAGYRIVELMAENNEGGVAIAMKFDAPSDDHSYPTLLMTERTYSRWAARDPLVTEASVLDGHKVYVYPNRE